MSKTAENAALVTKASVAGAAAFAAATAVPMHVVEHANPLDDNSPIVRAYAPVVDGVCGFAWVNIRPGGGSFARFCAKKGLGSKGYYGGFDVSLARLGIAAQSQSYEKKMVAARAVAGVLQDAGITAYPEGRLD